MCALSTTSTSAVQVLSTYHEVRTGQPPEEGRQGQQDDDRSLVSVRTILDAAVLLLRS